MLVSVYTQVSIVLRLYNTSGKMHWTLFVSCTASDLLATAETQLMQEMASVSQVFLDASDISEVQTEVRKEGAWRLVSTSAIYFRLFNFSASSAGASPEAG